VDITSATFRRLRAERLPLPWRREPRFEPRPRPSSQPAG
jgi:hypothetical protein